MSYANLISAWNGATQPPTGVTGTAITGGMTTAQKITAVNGWTVNGPAVPMVVPTYKIYNLIVASEFGALTTVNQQLIRDILGMGTVDASPGTSVRSRIVAIFPNGTATFAALSSLAATFDTPQIPWWQSTGGNLSGPVSLSDTEAAGLT